MIIQGHPDILRGPKGLNGLHGFGSLPPEGSSPAYIRFLPEKGGAGIEALYQEIRDFINTPGRTDAEIEQAMIASGVSNRDVENAFMVPGEKFVDTKEDYAFPEVTDIFSPVITDLSAAYLRFLPENGGQGLDVLYKEIRDFLATNPTRAQLEQTMQASGVNQADIDNAFAQQPPQLTDAHVRAALELAAQVAYLPTGLAPIPDNSLRNREIVDYVMTHSDAEILAAIATTGVTQSDIIQAFASFDPTMPNGQSPAYARSLPENGGAGIANFYREIIDFQNSHSFYELLSQMFRSEVSRADLEAANAYAFSQSPAGGGSGETTIQPIQPIQPIFEQPIFEQPKQPDYENKLAEIAAAEVAAEAESIRRQMEAEKYYWQKVREQRAAEAAAAAEQAEQAAQAAAEAEARRIAALRETEKPVDETGRQQAYLREQAAIAAAVAAAAAEAKAQAAIAAQAAQAQQALEATLAAQAAATAAAAAQAAAQAAREAAAAAAARGVDRAATAATAAAATAAAAKATAAATAAAAAAATAAAVVIAKTPGQSTAYTRFLPENGGKGITALYKEISDFVAVSSNAEIKTAMTASGVSEVDVIKALEVFPNKVTTQPAKDTGLVLPLVISAIAAFFLLG